MTVARSACAARDFLVSSETGCSAMEAAAIKAANPMAAPETIFCDVILFTLQLYCGDELPSVELAPFGGHLGRGERDVPLRRGSDRRLAFWRQNQPHEFANQLRDRAPSADEQEPVERVAARRDVLRGGSERLIVGPQGKRQRAHRWRRPVGCGESDA